MTQPGSLSGERILQQPFKWPLHPQSLPRQSTHAARFAFLCSQPHSPFSPAQNSSLSPRDMGDPEEESSSPWHSELINLPVPSAAPVPPAPGAPASGRRMQPPQLDVSEAPFTTLTPSFPANPNATTPFSYLQVPINVSSALFCASLTLAKVPCRVCMSPARHLFVDLPSNT